MKRTITVMVAIAFAISAPFYAGAKFRSIGKISQTSKPIKTAEEKGTSHASQTIFHNKYLALPSDGVEKILQQKEPLYETWKLLKQKDDIVHQIHKERKRLYQLDMIRLVDQMLENVEIIKIGVKSAATPKYEEISEPKKSDIFKLEKPKEKEFLNLKEYPDQSHVGATGITLVSDWDVEKKFEFTETSPLLEELLAERETIDDAVAQQFEEKLAIPMKKATPYYQVTNMINYLWWKLMDDAIFETEITEYKHDPLCKIDDSYTPVINYLMAVNEKDKFEAIFSLMDFYTLTNCLSANQMIYLDWQVHEALYEAVGMHDKLMKKEIKRSASTRDSGTKKGFFEKILSALSTTNQKLSKIKEPTNKVSTFTFEADEPIALIYGYFLNIGQGFLARNAYTFSAWQSLLCDASNVIVNGVKPSKPETVSAYKNIVTGWKPGNLAYEVGLWSYDSWTGTLNSFSPSEATGEVPCESVYKSEMDKDRNAWGALDESIFAICKKPPPVIKKDEVNIAAYLTNLLASTNLGYGDRSTEDIVLNRFEKVCNFGPGGGGGGGSAEITCEVNSSGSMQSCISGGSSFKSAVGNKSTGAKSTSFGPGPPPSDFGVEWKTVIGNQLCNNIWGPGPGPAGDPVKGGAGDGEGGAEESEDKDKKDKDKDDDAEDDDEEKEEDNDDDDDDDDKVSDADDDSDALFPDDGAPLFDVTLNLTPEQEQLLLKGSCSTALAFFEGNPQLSSEILKAFQYIMSRPMNFDEQLYFYENYTTHLENFETKIVITDEVLMKDTFVYGPDGKPQLDGSGNPVIEKLVALAWYDPSDDKIYVTKHALGTMELAQILVEEQMHGNLKTTGEEDDHLIMEVASIHNTYGSTALINKFQSDQDQGVEFKAPGDVSNILVITVNVSSKMQSPLDDAAHKQCNIDNYLDGLFGRKCSPKGMGKPEQPEVGGPDPVGPPGEGGLAMGGPGDPPEPETYKTPDTSPPNPCYGSGSPPTPDPEMMGDFWTDPVRTNKDHISIQPSTLREPKRSGK